MYDLRIGSVDAPTVAIECVRAMDATYTETWMVGPAKGPYALPVRGDWIVEIAATAPVKDVIQHLTRILAELEGRGIYNLTTDHWLKWGDEDLFNDIHAFESTMRLASDWRGAARYISRCREMEAQ